MANIDLATQILVKVLREGRPLNGFIGGGSEHLVEWSFTPTFRLWLADYLEAGNPVPPWLTAEHKVSPAIPVP